MTVDRSTEPRFEDTLRKRARFRRAGIPSVGDLRRATEEDALADVITLAREVARHSKRPTAQRDLREALARLDALPPEQEQG